MTREESLDIVKMIFAHWRGPDWTEEEIDIYARRIQFMDAEIATSTVIKASYDLQYRPSIMELTERYRAEKRRLQPVIEHIEAAPQEIPFWIKRWACARLLYERFGKERDMRRFPEQGDFGDISTELMPEGAWEEEVNSIPEGEFHAAFKKMFRP